MFEVECNNCREVNQLNDRMKNKTVRCHICKKVIQIGEVKKEVVRNINILDDHEDRIQVLEKPKPSQQYLNVCNCNCYTHFHPSNCCCPSCCCAWFFGLLLVIFAIVGIVSII